VLENFDKHLKENFPLLQTRSLLLAISGGLDSVVMLHLMRKYAKNCTIAHCNFQLRETESDLDALFVKNLGASMKIPVVSVNFDTEAYADEYKVSIQMAARKLRYDWFQKIKKERNIDFVLTGHHKEDALETFLINLSRGTGLDGLLGIPEVNESTVRPLLKFTREEIFDFAKKNNIGWREDRSNESIKYIRNKVRHKIVPILKELNPSLLKSFGNTLENLQQSQLLIQDRIENIEKQVVTKVASGMLKIDVKKIQALKNPKAHLYELLKSYGFNSSKDLAQLLEAQAGKQLFSKTHRLLKNRGELLLIPIEELQESGIFFPQNSSKIKSPINLSLEETSKTGAFHENTAYLDKKLLNGDLCVRKWKKGDYFYPIGMTGRKKVSKYFKDEKFSLFEKEKTWLLCNDDAIVWIIGKRLDERFKVSEKTTHILKISLKN
jgi:tRNA(Ile)-lysidine synthase